MPQTVPMDRDTFFQNLLPRLGRVTAMIGGGGKTTAVYTLAGYLAAAGYRVLITTTTHMGWPPRPVPNGVEVRGTHSGCKLNGIPFSDYPAAEREFDYILAEADGSHCLPLKWHRDDEPVIPPDVGLVLYLTGLSALGKPAGEVLHRQALSPIAAQHLITAEDMAFLIDRGLKKAAVSCPVLSVCNQLDTLPAGAQLPCPQAESWAVSLLGL